MSGVVECCAWHISTVSRLLAVGMAVSYVCLSRPYAACA
jgi:hypothetical protein